MANAGQSLRSHVPSQMQPTVCDLGRRSDGNSWILFLAGQVHRFSDIPGRHVNQLESPDVDPMHLNQPIPHMGKSGTNQLALYRCLHAAEKLPIAGAGKSAGQKRDVTWERSKIVLCRVLVRNSAFI